MKEKRIVFLLIVVCLLLLPSTLFASSEVAYTYNITTFASSNSYRIDVFDSSGKVYFSQIFESDIKPAVNLFNNGLVLIATSHGLALYSVKDLKLVSMYNTEKDVPHAESFYITNNGANSVSAVYSGTYFNTPNEKPRRVMYSIDESIGKIVKQPVAASDEGWVDPWFIIFACVEVCAIAASIQLAINEFRR